MWLQLMMKDTSFEGLERLDYMARISYKLDRSLNRYSFYRNIYDVTIERKK